MVDLLKKDVLYRKDLDIDLFSHVLDTNSQCYKFYWLEALIKILVRDQKEEITFDEAADEMIVSSWYTVSEFHLHMGSPYAGKQDVGALEKIINKVQLLSGLASSADETDIRKALSEYGSHLYEDKMQLTALVPQRLLSSYVNLPGNHKKSLRYIYELITEANEKAEHPLPYTIRYQPGLKKVVVINTIWAEMFRKNANILFEWIDAKKIRYLQDRNPGVPGIVYKLRKSGDRSNLKAVRDLWKAIMQRDNVIDIFTEELINDKPFAIDHFIPWAYIASDELWNLNPISKSINSSKLDRLPEWDKYFPSFQINQYQLYEWKRKDQEIEELFNKCANHHINSLWANNELYLHDNSFSEFSAILEENMKPIYKSARLQGFQMWLF